MLATPARPFSQVARGDEPADLLLKNAKVVNVFTGDIDETNIAIVHSRIAGLGDYQAHQVEDLHGRYVCPGFIDAHVHIESAMVPPNEFARAVVPRGTTTVVSDPHEIANVLGLEGIRYMLEMAKYNPLSTYIMAPSCVPATDMETTGAALHWYDLQTLQHEPYVLGLGEMMNFPGVVQGSTEALDKLRAFQGQVKDGHAPGLHGKALMAYAAANIGSDHECTTVEEAREKLSLGMFIFLREATNAHNLRDLLPVVSRHTSRRLCFCTDDRVPADLLDDGHIDHLVRVAVAEGIEPVTAIRMATLNPSEYFHLHDRGAIAPARRADLVVFSDLNDFRADMVYRGGKLVAQDGQVIAWERPQRPTVLRSSMNVDWSHMNFRIQAEGRRLRIIGLVPDQIITQHLIEELPSREGEVVAEPGRDILKMAVVERHLATGNVGLGFVKGFGLSKGAIASTVAHDHHNIVVAGADDESMFTAVQAITATRGGMATAYGDSVLAQLPLPIAGLMSDQPIETVRRQMDEVLASARQLGSPLHDPFMALSFLALPVIPALKLTDLGLVDVEQFHLVSLFVS
jgi:adenine deaminase